MLSLSPRQVETLRFIRTFLSERGYAPSLREIADHLGVKSVATAHQHVHALEAKGAIEKEWNRMRSIVPVGVVDGGVVTLPLFGRIPASPPSEACVQADEVEVPRVLVGVGEHFALTVSGDSMIEEGIHDGDIVVVKRQPVARDGQAVAVLLNGEVTLKKIYRHSGRVELRPANATMAPIFVDRGDLQVQGVVVALLRKYPLP